MDERFCLKRELKQIICKPFPLAVLKVIVFRSVSDCSEATAIDILVLMVRIGEGQSSHVLVFCVNSERHICTHITTSIKCYLNSLTYVYVPSTNI